MTDDIYGYWRRAIEITGGKRSLTRAEQQELVVTEDPQAGFFRRRTVKAGPFIPCAIWPADGAMVGAQDGKAADPTGFWTYCCPHPVTHEAYTQRVETGRWPDEDEGVTDSFGLPPVGPSLGDNNPPEETPLEALERQITAAAANLDAYKTLGTDEDAGKAQAVRSRLLDLGGQTDRLREAEKKPHLEAGRAVDAKFKPLVDKAAAGANTLRAALSAYLTAKERREAEARRKAEDDAREAARAAAAANQPAPPPPAPAPEPPPAASTFRGASGRAASVKTVKKATVADLSAFVAFVVAQPEASASRQELVALADRLADRAVKAGLTPPGVTTEDVKDVR